MSTLGLIALGIAVVAVGVVMLLRSRTAVADSNRPKTVADLVRLRAESSGSPVPAAVAQTGGRDAAAPDRAGPPAPPPRPVTVVPDRPQTAAPGPWEPERQAGPATAQPPPAGIPEQSGPAVPIPRPAEPPREPPAPQLRPTVDDTPWGRAARMVAGGDGTGSWQAPASVEVVPLRLVSPTDRSSGTGSDEWTGWADWADVDAEEDARSAPAAPAPDPGFGASGRSGSRGRTADGREEIPDPRGGADRSPAPEPEPASTEPAAVEPGAAGSSTAGSSTAGSTAADLTAAGSTGAGSTTAEPTAAGPNAAGPTAAGPTAAGSSAGGSSAGGSSAGGAPAAGSGAAGSGAAEPTAGGPVPAGPTAIDSSAAGSGPADVRAGASGGAGPAAAASVAAAPSAVGRGAVGSSGASVGSAAAVSAGAGPTSAGPAGAGAGSAPVRPPVAEPAPRGDSGSGQSLGIVPATSGPPTPSGATPVAGSADAATTHGRQSATERAAEQAAADLALLRTFGFADPSLRPDSAPVVQLFSRHEPGPEPLVQGAPQPVRFRAVRRGGAPAGKVAVTLLDDRGRVVAEDVAGADGRGEMPAPGAGSFVLVCTAPGHQPGATAITVMDGPIDTEVLLVRSASLSGSVHGEDGPIVGARVTLVQDGEIVDSVDTGPDADYRIEDLAGGEYGLSVVAAGCEPIAILLEVPDEADLRHDVDLEPAGIRTDDDLSIGQP